MELLIANWTENFEETIETNIDGQAATLERDYKIERDASGTVDTFVVVDAETDKMIYKHTNFIVREYEA